MDHLGIEAAHFATQMPADLAELAETHPERIGGLVLCVPTRLDPGPFSAVAGRLLMISGDKGLTVDTTVRAAERLPDAARHVLTGYEAAGWSDVVADRPQEVADVMDRFFARADQNGARMVSPIGASGDHAGLTWRVDGAGPPLILLPFFLAPSQWTPAVEHLARNYTVIRLGGPNIGGVAALEDRARAPTYRAMFGTLADFLAPLAGDRVLDVGCGSGALDRLLARRFGASVRIDAIDLNGFFLDEARALAAKEGLGEQIHFAKGSAVDLPFADATFDRVFSVTVLEECDADTAIAEMMRVARPGARIGIVVRAIDLKQWWNLDLPADLEAKTAVPPQSIGPGGVADHSLYSRMRRAGMVDLQAFPALVTLDRPDGPIWRYREDAVLSQLSPAETAVWRAARAKAASDGVLMQSHALHAAVATKPMTPV
jgi:SAM-dependent methyltransferase